MTAEDFGDFTCTGGEDGCTVNAEAIPSDKLTKAARKKLLYIEIDGPTTANTTGDGKVYIPIGPDLDAHNIVSIEAFVVSTGTGGTLNIDLAICAATATGNACSGTVVDVLSTNLTVDASESKSTTAAAATVIDTDNDDLDTGEYLRADIDAVHSSTPAQGLTLIIGVQPE